MALRRAVPLALLLMLGCPSAYAERNTHSLLRGRVRSEGLERPFTLLFARDGRFLLRIEGPIGEVDAWDGLELRHEDWNGAVARIRGTERRERLLAPWAVTGFLGSAAAPVTWAEGQRVRERVVVWDGTEIARAELDEEGDVRSLKLTRGNRGTVFEFERGGESPGERALRAWTRTRGGSRERFEVESSEEVVAEGSSFTLETGLPGDTTFDLDTGARVEVRRGLEGHWLVRPELEGRVEGWFLFDTGASHTCIDTQFAERLGLDVLAPSRVDGIGGSREATLRLGTSFHLGRLRWRNPLYVTLDLSALERSFDVPVVGILGYDVLCRGLFRMDLTSGTLEVHDPRSPLDPELLWQPLVFLDRRPAFAMRCEGEREGFLRLDTGDAGSLTFHRGAVDEWTLLDGRATRPSYRSGLFGIEPSRRGTLAWVEFLGVRAREIDVHFSRADDGVHADPELAGTLGLALFAPYEVLLDYAGSRIALRPAR